MLRSSRSLAVLATVAGCLAVGGCGGSLQAGHPAPGTAPTARTQGSTRQSPRPQIAPTARSAAASAAVSQCGAQAPNDPASLALCLARHGVKLSGGDGPLARCVQAAQNATMFDACLKQNAR
jgi:hypothetical protein